jgi:hypothetical protein
MTICTRTDTKKSLVGLESQFKHSYTVVGVAKTIKKHYAVIAKPPKTMHLTVALFNHRHNFAYLCALWYDGINLIALFAITVPECTSRSIERDELVL